MPLAFETAPGVTPRVGAQDRAPCLRSRSRHPRLRCPCCVSRRLTPIARLAQCPYAFGSYPGGMPLAREQRKLAAILFADAVGSSRLMGRDESGTVAGLLEHLNQRLAPAAARRGGRVVRLKGDGSLVEFASAVDALAAAIAFQQTMIEANRGQPDDQAIVFRIGLHLGDVIVEGDDIYGDAVNVAARLEAEAPAGGIVVSRAVREAVTGRLKVSLHALGSLPSRISSGPSALFARNGALKIGLRTLLRREHQRRRKSPRQR